MSKAALLEELPAGHWRVCTMVFTLKRAVLILFVIQTTSYVLLIRYSKTRLAGSSTPPYLSTVTVFLGEVFKLLACLVMVARAAGGVTPMLELLRAEVLGNRIDTLKCAVPAVAYTIQSNLMFVALANLDAPTFQVTYQTRTLFTALFSRLFLGRQLTPLMWLALLLLTAGASLASEARGGARGGAQGESSVLGLSAVLAAAVLSSGASVYFELVLKTPPTSAAAAAAGLWLRNIQLGVFATPLAAAAVLAHDGERVRRHGLLAGFDGLVWLVALNLGVGGLLVAATMKYADNILKCFATALAVLSGTLLSVPLFGFELTHGFALGASCTVGATALYSLGHEGNGKRPAQPAEYEQELQKEPLCKP
jgi:UDP-sugar transporter A1/2/3